MKRCRTCVIPTSRPDTHFDETGQCSACASYERRPTIDWPARKAELLALLDRHNGRCLVPSSGGKDSHYQVLTLLELGADVTIVTATTCAPTPIGRENIRNLSRYAMTVEVTPSRTVRSKLNRLGLTLVGDASWPQHASIWAIPFQMAVSMKRPLMVWGENSQNSYGGPPGTDEARHMTLRWCAEFGGYNGLRPSDFVGVEGITERDMQPYQLPSFADLARVGVEAHFLGAYIPWDSHHNAEVAHKHGMIWEDPGPANWWIFENQDCYVTAWHDYFAYLKFGFGRLAAQISVDIRQGRITREEAMEVVRERDGLFPILYMRYPMEALLREVGISRDAFVTACNQFMNRDLFVESAVKWGQHLTLKEFG